MHWESSDEGVKMCHDNPYKSSRWVKAHYGVNKKLSQFDKFLYLWNFDTSW
jgi:hypothetical protein